MLLKERAVSGAPDTFYQDIFRLVMPIVLQNLLNTAVNSADVVMLGYVGQTALSASSLANQWQFILNLIYSGITSGMIMLVAQYWGKGDTRTIEKIMGIATALSALVSAAFAVLACFFPQIVMLFFTNDPELIEAGSSYLRIIGVSYLFMSISQVYLNTMRAIERVAFSTVVSGAALVINIGLNAVFIFGLFGAPKMGIVGVALATLIARVVETGACLADSLRFRTIQFRPSRIFRFERIIFKDFIHYALPALGNDIVWGVGFAMYSVIMGHLGSDIVAANSVVVVVRNLGTAVCFGLASGGAILLGKEIGENRVEDVKRHASKLCWVTFASGIAGGLVVLLVRALLPSIGNLTETANEYLRIMLLINGYYVLGQAMNTTVVLGVFRSGGDSRFGFICDTIDMWVFAVPLGFITAFVLHLPPMVVYFLICLDEFVKMPVVYRHYKSYKWLKNITREMGEDTRVGMEES